MLTVFGVCSPVASAVGQEPAATTSRASDQLLPIVERLIQKQQDLLVMARPHHRYCDTMSSFKELEMATALATEQIQSVHSLLAMYSLISTPADRRNVKNLVVVNVALYREALEVQIKSVNLTLGFSSTPPGLAVLGTQVRDDIRAAIGFLQEDYLR
jgi:hypothetical protein